MNSEFRQDPVSGDWVIIAPKRALRPDQFKKQEKRKTAPVKGCPFENPQKTGHGDPVLVYPNLNKWIVQIIKNKFPSVSHANTCAQKIKHGPYSSMQAVGYHDVVISRNHFNNFAHLGKNEAKAIFEILKKRYVMLAKDSCLKYISIFHNWGPKAGASIFHPHCQIISLPIIPPDVSRSLWGSFRYFKKEKKCVHCDIIKSEVKHKKRVVFENKNIVAFTTYASKEPFELKIFPKKHLPYFEETSADLMSSVVEALQSVLAKIEKKLGDPDYIFFIHTAPVGEKKSHKHYHWHIEIQPKFSVSAGFEISTGIEITIIDPDEAAALLRK